MVNTNNKSSYKSGFSLFEACVTMLIVGIFIAMCANAFTRRHVTYQESDGHGRYECYREGGAIAQRYVENNSARPVAGTTCVFRPPRYAKYILINAIGGGSGSAAGTFSSSFYSSIDKPLTIEPGASGQQTTVSMDNQTILSVAAGGGDMVATSSSANKVASCTVEPGFKVDGSALSYSCGTDQTCGQSGSDLKITYCMSDSDFKTVTIPLSTIKADRYTASGNTITYYDLSNYQNVGHMTAEDALSMIRDGNRAYSVNYIVKVTMDTSAGSNVSLMEQYLDVLGVEDGIATTSPGAPGSSGGVVILW